MLILGSLIKSIVKSVLPTIPTTWSIKDVAAQLLPRITPFNLPGSRVLKELRNLGGQQRTEDFYAAWTPSKVAYEIGESQEPWFRDPVSKADYAYEYRASVYSVDPAGVRYAHRDVPLYSDTPLSKEEVAARFYEEWEEGEGVAGMIGGYLQTELWRVTITGGAVRTGISGVRPPW